MRSDTKVAVRDLLIFWVKLWLDGFKDGILLVAAPVSLGADLVFRLEGRNRLFYRVLRAGERFDKWLNLHGALEHADPGQDGLFGQSPAGADTLLGQIEKHVRGGDEPRSGRSAQRDDEGV